MESGSELTRARDLSFHCVVSTCRCCAALGNERSPCCVNSGLFIIMYHHFNEHTVNRNVTKLNLSLLNLFDSSLPFSTVTLSLMKAKDLQISMVNKIFRPKICSAPTNLSHLQQICPDIQSTLHTKQTQGSFKEKKMK